MAVEQLPIYEAGFLGDGHGFRPAGNGEGRSFDAQLTPQSALKEALMGLRTTLYQ